MEALLYEYAWFIPVYPLVAALILGVAMLGFNPLPKGFRTWAAGLVISLSGVSLTHALSLFFSQLWGHEAYRWTFTWAKAGPFAVEMGFTLDHLTAMMLVVVTTVAILVQIYTDGYMHHDPGYTRFYAYLSLFSASMLGLVVSPNLVQIYVFWELVGMCSYLLIGFWYDRPAAAEACQKAFVVNRVGDFGLLLGILGLYWLTGSFEFERLPDLLQDLIASGSVSTGLVAIFCVLVFLGPVAKSAQFPLHVWLPDAMEGPTPISALIHAATMVAAGIFLVARLFPVFEGIPLVMSIIAWTGGVTAFLGASIAITQNDIKKGLAYSTISQLGYMMMAMGSGAYSAGLFHLMTHAYFKAMLFLGSGSVIHGMEAVVGHNPLIAQDMRYMGGLKKYMPYTATTFLIGTLAICGIPPFAGFWSKDEILGSVFAYNPVLWVIGFLTAGITAFYMFRMYFMTFEGSFRGSHAPHDSHHDSHSHADHHASEPHESPWTMTLPLVVLAVPSVLIGLVGTPFANGFEAFVHAPEGEAVLNIAPELAEQWHHVLAGEFEWTEFLVMGGSSVGIGLIGISLAVLMYVQKVIDPAAIAKKIQPLYQFSLNKWYFDQFYDRVFVQGTRLAAREALEVDSRIVDGVVNFTGLVTMLSGEALKYLESGKAQFYALIVFASVVVIVVISGLGF